MLADDLLLWLSAQESGSWFQFCNAVRRLQDVAEEIEDELESSLEKQELDPATTLSLHRLLQLNLAMLGHTEFYYQGTKYMWRTVPPFLGITELKEKMYAVLCGARWPEFIDGILKSATEFADISIERYPLDNAPEALRMNFERWESIIEFARKNGLGVQKKVSLTLLTSVPSLRYPKLLRPNPLPFGKGWTVEHFDTGRLRWTPILAGDKSQPQQGLNRYSAQFAASRYFLVKRGRRQHHIVSYEVSPRVGKYLVLRGKKRTVMKYNSETNSIELPAVCRPPFMVERALVLCSGLVPTLDRNFELTYKDIPAEVARIAGKLLEQEVG